MLRGRLLLFGLPFHKFLNNFNSLNDDFFKDPLAWHQFSLMVILIDRVQVMIDRLQGGFIFNAVDPMFEFSYCGVRVDALQMVDCVLNAALLSSLKIHCNFIESWIQLEILLLLMKDLRRILILHSIVIWTCILLWKINCIFWKSGLFSAINFPKSP